ncbi:MAG: glucose-1-phosphate adenylyltransferase [Verrucomicrobiae bacterium]|nr:glucose-1-phosphate adenylyltransferase [Verrucomicrobiae bacterium]MCP5541025.1 glucose-1-phosphate adenylyltransferase [Akkermansiaceae bacterium]MCP5551544.1 glucose-1-phosphate adenylyltransferase [Akkermansiaceae bacterium]
MPLSLPAKTTRSTLAIIMGGGQGSRLFPLTHRRSKPAVPLAGKYRLVDIPISNCINSSLRQIYVLTQFNSESLHRHITAAYHFDHFSRDFVHILAAQQTPGREEWYQGTADAVRQNLSYFLERPYEYFLILSGDQLYRMDYRLMLKAHIEKKADVTIATTPVEREAARSFGIMATDAESRIVRFAEKPGADDSLLDTLRMPEPLLVENGLPASAERFQASMGIYIFNRSVLQACLQSELKDFGRDVIPGSIENNRVFSYVFQGYWEDIGTIKSFYEANLGLTRIVPSFNFFDSDNTIFTRARFLPASKINNANVDEALISDGCIISNATVRHSIIGVRSVIESGCEISDSVIMGADYYHRSRVDADGQVVNMPIRIGSGTRIHRAIVDKNACIGNNVTIDPAGRTNADAEYCHVRDGIVVVPKGTVIPDGTVV